MENRENDQSLIVLIFLVLAQEAELGAHHTSVGCVEDGREALQSFGGQADCVGVMFGNEREKRFGKPCKVPLRNARLIGKCVATTVIECPGA